MDYYKDYYIENFSHYWKTWNKLSLLGTNHNTINCFSSLEEAKEAVRLYKKEYPFSVTLRIGCTEIIKTYYYEDEING